ncbi:MAG: replication-associated recombination protein A [Deltaproteobacteria bacterium]|nr:MAG: replication-associated recombination protein A [Deltaproteobacteria bacterium]
MRPRCLEEFVGQTQIMDSEKLMGRLLRHGRLQSLILWGPPGCGKTTLARLIASDTGSHLINLSAVTAGVREVRAAVDDAKQQRSLNRRPTILFVDEIHRFNKAQQDLLLPHVESGTITFIGATTENPSFEVIPPLLSRAPVVVLEPLSEDDVEEIVASALMDGQRGLGKLNASVDEDGMKYLVRVAQGDARLALNGLELAVLTTAPDQDGRRRVDLQNMVDAIQRKALIYDKNGEEHYNLISALHKSLRGNDPDAALYWLARMLAAGEDPLYLARRMVRFASEDVGLADPNALVVTVAAKEAFHLMGRPEGDLALAEAAVYLATAPKSNALYKAYDKAKREVEERGSLSVPLSLRNAPTQLMRQLNYGSGYRYPHDYQGAHVPMSYLPESLENMRFYEPTNRGYEATLGERLKQWRKRVGTTHRQAQSAKPTAKS